MTTERFTLDPGVRALLHDIGASLGRVLRRARLPAGLLGDGPARLTTDEYYRFWEALDAETGDPDLAVRIGRAISAEVFDPPLFAALCSPDLASAAERIATFKPLIAPTVLDVVRSPRGLTITFNWPPGTNPPRLLSIAELAFFVALARLGTRHAVHAVRVAARRPPEASDEISNFFGVQVRRGRADSITFAPEDATRPFLTEDEPMWRFFAPELRRRLSDLQAAANTADRVRAVLHEILPAGDSAMTTVARELATSSRTLQRQLQAEGTSYQAVLTGTREQLARHYLTDSTLGIAKIAYLLAYDDTNSFYRAFRTWTGCTPDSVRAEHAARPRALPPA
ncbi:AraC family transcriptional regulator [Frankia sp. Ag45/Mut15]|uniref:AraC family transcriptional regulator n=1 Tax=Frankia umida TaxID=573489 RepID=A0ABT0JSJ5_9ACTN|nr:AraC family transcriptional regulator [Frankia umida]MCK9874526.1 AraC family transcriptional regulator [Frankia umida]